jgi:hypothetical protein
MSNYKEQALQFLKDTGTTLTIKFKKRDVYFNDDKPNDIRNIYTCTLKNTKGSYTFTFGDSIHNTQNNLKPSEYDILSTLEKYRYADYNDFLSIYGFEHSKKNEKIYIACDKQLNALEKLFNEEEIIRLQDIS